MGAVDVLGTVAERLVGGMMFHSDHADLCMWLGVRWLSKLHEDGYSHDAGCLRDIHRASVRFCGLMPEDGRQQRTHTLDAYRQTERWSVKPDVRAAALRDAMHDWVDWEAGTVQVLASAYRRLFDCGETAVACKVKSITKDTERELAHARDLLCEMEAVGWDMAHIYEMEERRR